jgi:hypothetical protein
MPYMKDRVYTIYDRRTESCGRLELAPNHTEAIKRLLDSAERSKVAFPESSALYYLGKFDHKTMRVSFSLEPEMIYDSENGFVYGPDDGGVFDLGPQPVK